MNVSALDENGRPVDWWFMYKVPKLHAGNGGDAATGYEYVYYDATIDKEGGPVAASQHTIDSGKGALNETLNAVFGCKDPSLGWILYNDETPDAAKITDDGNLGHTKGVIAFDVESKTAWWLLHSWPKFAEPKTKRDPTPMYGQTYLCLTLGLEAVSDIALQMSGHQEPQTYQCRTPAKLARTDPLYVLTQGVKLSPTPATSVLDLKTRGRMPFRIIAKNRAWNDDFWNNLVGPTLKADIDVETWIRGDKIPLVADSDGVHKTFDIKFINLGALGIHMIWPESHDHAKWAIATDSDWICVGDINRMVSQRKRGGGTIAFQNQTLWRALSKTSFILTPPGMSRTETHKLIQATHPKPNPVANVRAKVLKPAKRAKAAGKKKRR